MKANFEKAFVIVIGNEGGYTVDSGGETNFGISQKAYPELDIKGLTLDDAKAIYKKDYWDKIGGDDIQEGLDIAAFDCAVNQGVGTARRLLIGTITLEQFMRKRLRKYIETAQKGRLEMYLKGWFNRVLNTWDKIEA